LKIAFLTARLSEVRGGGILLCNYAKALGRYSHVDATVYSIEKPQTDYSKLRDVFDEEVMAKIKFLELPQEEKMENKLFRGLRFFESILLDVGETGIRDVMHLGVLRRGRYKYQPKLAYFRDLLLEHFEDYDIVHMGAWYGLYTFAASKLKGVLDFRTVVHSIYHDASFGIMGWKTCREILSRVNAVTTSTVWEEKSFKKLRLSNVYFVGEGVDIEYIENETAKMPMEEDLFTVIYIGVKDHGKGYYHALLAMNEFAKKVGYNNVRMIGIGRGSLLGAPLSLQKNVFEAYRMLKQHGCIEDYTFVSETEKLRHLKRAHVVLLPSKAETIPLVTLEAWALKKPSILCGIPTVKSVIGRDGNGVVLVNYGDINGMVRKLEDFYKNPDLLSSVGLRGHAILMEYGSLKSVSARLLSVYEKILE
jgi:glycosyltransferase involved in cell wall biosynthesis